ncbi:MAG TPA: S1C family serine protease [Caulobacteraceae bacterium]|jgi:S1-C subfamily serine protease|nr:S1C family serine protease [Caulobacteraceae bacterium]
MASPFDGYEVDRALRPPAEGQAFDLKRALDAVVVLYAEAGEDASTARSLGAQRLGNGIVIGTSGLVLTIGYLITEAQSITLLTNDGRRVAAHALGTDAATGFGLVHALEPLDLPTLPLGDSRKLRAGDPVILAGGGGRAHALAGRLLAREPFAGYWEYLLDEALFTGPGHPHWSGGALIGPSGALMGVASLQMSQVLADRRTGLINMCVPIELLPPIVDDLSHGRPARPPRPWMGLISQEAGEQVVVVEVAEGSPAEAAGVRPGDVVVAVDGQKVSELADLYTKVWALGPAGVDAPLRLRRGARLLDLTLHTIDRATRLKKPRFN